MLGLLDLIEYNPWTVSAVEVIESHRDKNLSIYSPPFIEGPTWETRVGTLVQCPQSQGWSDMKQQGGVYICGQIYLMIWGASNYVIKNVWVPTKFKQ